MLHLYYFNDMRFVDDKKIRCIKYFTYHRVDWIDKFRGESRLSVYPFRLEIPAVRLRRSHCLCECHQAVYKPKNFVRNLHNGWLIRGRRGLRPDKDN